MKMYTNDWGLSSELVQTIAKFHGKTLEQLGLRIERGVDHYGNTLYSIRSNIVYVVPKDYAASQPAGKPA